MKYTLVLVFGGLTQLCQQYFRYNKVAFQGIIFPNDLLGLGEMCPLLNDIPDHGHLKYLPRIIQRHLLNPLWDIFGEVFYNCSRKFLKVCSGTVLEKTKVSSRTVMQQTIRTFLNCSGTILKMF